ncbi:MAG: permease-like cell division protein FtsX [Myxococcales bacterium]|nr:permease-like cell division protein FtsX [Polyangiaceae bacterium]MDW8249689.1 permease-like cell division protein FtsX [Myxococcales bacterium]
MNGTTSRAWRNGKADWKMHLLSIFSLSVAFVCLASALLVVSNLDRVRQRWSRVGRTTVYLRDNADPAQVQELREAINRTAGVRTVRYVSPEEARRELVAESSDGALAALPAQAFSASLEVDFQEDLADADVSSIAGKIRSIPVVDGVETYARWSERLGRLLDGGVAASLLLSLVVSGAVISVVASTMRMALERRRVEVEVLQLVGATHGYVRAPFLVEGAAQGGLGAAAAVLLLALLYSIVRGRFDGELALILGVEPIFLPWHVIVAMVLGGALLGALSSAFSLRRLSCA